MYLERESSGGGGSGEEEEEIGSAEATIGEKSCVTKFIKSLIALMENGAKAHLRHLTEFFGLLYEFSRMGEEETKFLLQINVIKSVSDFYLGHKNHNNVSIFF
jgi:ubiquitin carboxyl-terminal hydrolase 34